MVIVIVLGVVFFTLTLTSGTAEFKYYQAVKNLEPEIWSQLGSPALLKVSVVFVSPHGAALLKRVTNETVNSLAIKHRRAGLLLIGYVTLLLLGFIVYFQFA